MNKDKFVNNLAEPICHKIFPLGIYENEISCHHETKKTILANYDKEKFAVTEKRNLVLPDGKIVEEEVFKFTGEAHGLATFHKKQEYSNFFSELSSHAFRYLNMLGLDSSKVDIYVMKSWLVIHDSPTDNMPFHVHPESNISFVYYAQITEDSQAIVFHNSYCANEISQDIFYCDTNSKNNMLVSPNKLNETEHIFPAKEGTIIMFPGWKTKHGTRSLEKKEYNSATFKPRLAIAGDLKVVLKPDYLATMTLSSSLNYWEKISR